MRRFSICLAATLAATAAVAQAPQGQYFVLHQELAKPSMIKEYEAAAKDFVALVKANKSKMPRFFFNGLMSRDFTYTYVAPIPSFAGMDAINAEFGALAQAAGPAFLELNKRSGAATEYIKESVVERMPELSYQPAQPLVKPSEAKYHHYDLYYAMPGREPEAEALAADYVKLFKAKGVSLGYNFYKAVIGPELPLYIVSVAATDVAQYHAEDAKAQALLGAELQALQARATALTRRFESREAWLRPDLSVPPPPLP